jgi:hypothetical protein
MHDPSKPPAISIHQADGARAEFSAPDFPAVASWLTRSAPAIDAEALKATMTPDQREKCEQVLAALRNVPRTEALPSTSSLACARTATQPSSHTMRVSDTALSA